MYKKYVSFLALSWFISLMSSSGMASINKTDFDKLNVKKEASSVLLSQIEKDFIEDRDVTLEKISRGGYDTDGRGITLLFPDGTVVAASGHVQEDSALINLSYLVDETGSRYVKDLLDFARDGHLMVSFIKGVTIRGQKTNARIYAKLTTDRNYIIMVRDPDSETLAPNGGSHEMLDLKKNRPL